RTRRRRGLADGSVSLPHSSDRRCALLLLGCPLSVSRGVSRHRGADELLEGDFVDLLSFAEVDRTPRIPFQAGIEELLRVFDGGSASEGELYDLLVRFPCADDAVMGPDGGSGGFWLLPFQLLLDVGVGIVDELTDMSEGLSSPIPQLFNPLGDVRGSGLAIRTTCRLHANHLIRFHREFAASIRINLLGSVMNGGLRGKFPSRAGFRQRNMQLDQTFVAASPEE